VKAVCEAWEVPRSSHYYAPAEPDNTAAREAILRVAGEWPTYGYRRVTAQLRREGCVLNRKRVLRLMGELGLVGKPPARKVHTTDSAHPWPRYPNLLKGSAVTAPDQAWVADITYVRLLREFVYLAVLMDVFTRSIRGWRLGRSLEGELTLWALQSALVKGTPRIHHSDQGLQYAQAAYTRTLEAAGVQVSMAAVGKPEENGYAERLIRTIKEEEVILSDYRDFEDARSQIGRFLDEVYTHKRIHSSLGYLTPAEFEAEWLQNQLNGGQPLTTLQ
jgi:transposase InsO family protein